MHRTSGNHKTSCIDTEMLSDGTEPTICTRPHHALLPLQQAADDGAVFIACTDMSLSTSINGSSLSPAALTWAGRYVSHRDKRPVQGNQSIELTQGVHTSVGILSSGGARTPYHTEQLALGAANMLYLGHGKVWYLAGADFLDRLEKMHGKDSTMAVYTKTMWSNYTAKGETLLAMNV